MMNVKARSTFCLLATVFAMGGQVHGQFWYGNDNSQSAGTQRSEFFPGGPEGAAANANPAGAPGSAFRPLLSNPWRRSPRVAQLPAPSSVTPSGGDTAGLSAPTNSATLGAASDTQLNTLPAPQSGQAVNEPSSAQPGWTPGNAWGPAAGGAYGGGAYGTAAGGCGIGGYPGGYCGPHPVNPLIGTKRPRPVGFMFRWDRLYLTIDEPNSIPIGDPGSEGIFLSNGIPYPFTNSVDTNYIDRDPVFGDRLEFGFLGANYGWLGSVLLWGQTKEISLLGADIQFNDPIGMLLGYQDADGDEIDDDLDGDGIYGRSGVDLDNDGEIDAPSLADPDDLVTWVPNFADLTVRNRTDINGFELMGYVNRGSTQSLVWSWMLGVRYVELDDRLTINASGSFLDSTEFFTKIENFLVGPQIGLQSCYCRGPWAINLSGRFLAAVNSQRGRQRGFFASEGEPNQVNQPVNLHPTAFASFQSDSQFSPVVEWRVESIYDLTRWLAVRIGYTGMYFGGIGRAASSDIDFTLPEFGFNLNNDDEVFANALTLGLEVTY